MNIKPMKWKKILGSFYDDIYQCLLIPHSQELFKKIWIMGDKPFLE